MGTADFIGGRGEAIVEVRLSVTPQGGDSPYFWPLFLGEKSETFDYLVRMVGAGDKPSYFFVQVKSTRSEFTTSRNPPRLRVQAPREDVVRMAAFPAPTYLVGVHEPSERVFIVGIDGAMSHSISSITTAHELTDETLFRLWNEVNEFWRHFERCDKTSAFRND